MTALMPSFLVSCLLFSSMVDFTVSKRLDLTSQFITFSLSVDRTKDGVEEQICKSDFAVFSREFGGFRLLG
jgi:hypothetical protein